MLKSKSTFTLLLFIFLSISFVSAQERKRPKSFEFEVGIGWRQLDLNIFRSYIKSTYDYSYTEYPTLTLGINKIINHLHLVGLHYTIGHHSYYYADLSNQIFSEASFLTNNLLARYQIYPIRKSPIWCYAGFGLGIQTQHALFYDHNTPNSRDEKYKSTPSFAYQFFAAVEYQFTYTTKIKCEINSHPSLIQIGYGRKF